jgi:hypothetical protein
MSTRIFRACDACEAEGIDGAGTQRPPFLGRTVDVCDPHWDVMTVKELIELTEERGAPVGDTAAPPKARRGPGRPRKAPVGAEHPRADQLPFPVFGCPLCGHDAPSASALGQHFRAIHGTDVAGVFGDTCPVCGVESGTAGIGIHLNRKHGISGGMAGGFAWARDNGDPAGVLTARRAVWEATA